MSGAALPIDAKGEWREFFGPGKQFMDPMRDLAHGFGLWLQQSTSLASQPNEDHPALTALHESGEITIERLNEFVRSFNQFVELTADPSDYESYNLTEAVEESGLHKVAPEVLQAVGYSLFWVMLGRYAAGIHGAQTGGIMSDLMKSGRFTPLKLPKEEAE